MIDPIGTWRDDFRVAKLAALIQNLVMQLYAKKGTNPKLRTIVDEMPDWLGDRTEEMNRKQSVEEMREILLSIASTQNRKVAMQNRGLNDPPIKLQKKRTESKLKPLK
jgi:hypothetical protein